MHVCTYIYNEFTYICEIKLKINLLQPRYILMQSEPVKMPFSSLYVGNLLLGMPPTLKFILFP